jgi:hypothetical protein
MTRTLFCAALAALLSFPLAAPAAGPDGAAPAKDRRFDLDLSVAVLGGGLDGYGVRRQSGGQTVLEASAQPQVRGDRWYLDVPLRVAHRQTFGTDLSETKGSLEAEPWYVASRSLRLGLQGGVSGANRPDWPDLYQPTNPSGGGLLPTDRYSYFAWRGGAQLWARPAARQNLRASYRYVSYDYVQDSLFDPGDIMHLTPRDRTEHQVDTSWRYHQDTWKVGLALDYTHRAYDTLLARRRRSGATSPDPVTSEINPKQKLDMWQPSAQVGFKRMGGKVEITLGYGLDVWNDPFQGYYSLTAHVPEVKAQVALSDRLEATLGVKGWYATYTSDGARPSSLEGGDTRRKDSKTQVAGEVEYALRGGLAFQARLGFVTRSTNYRDYVPVSAGGTSQYDIDFDYTNFTALAGFQYKM